jgi:uncharacterized integral membrane protein (TIGR00698 family)
MSFAKEHRAYTLNGVLFVGLFALSSLYIAQISWLAKSGISSLVIAIVLGIFYSNTLRHRLPAEWNPGIQFAAKKLLRLAIILYGFRISFQEITSIGAQGLILDVIVVTMTLLFGSWLGMKLLKLDRHLAILISCGAAICGAAAVLAAEDVLKSEPYKTTIAIGTVVLFGTLAMFLYPMLQQSGVFGFTENQFGVFVGASVHEVAQALVAGDNISMTTGHVAVIVKMTRVLLLVPALILLSFYESRVARHQGQHKMKLCIPWFAILFGVMIGVNSLDWLSVSFVNMINQFDVFLLTMAMAAIGIETNLLKIRKVGLKPLYLSVLLFGWLTGGVYLLVKYVTF